MTIPSKKASLFLNVWIDLQKADNRKCTNMEPYEEKKHKEIAENLELETGRLFVHDPRLVRQKH